MPLRIPLLLPLLFTLVAVSLDAEAACNATSSRELAWRYAPVHHQDADSTKYRADMLTRLDFDDDWVMNDNWEAAQALTSNPLPAVALGPPLRFHHLLQLRNLPGRHGRWLRHGLELLQQLGQCALGLG